MKQKRSDKDNLLGWRLHLASAALVLFGILNLSHGSEVVACSAVAVGNPVVDLLVGGNFDWRARGGMIFLSPRGQVKTSSFAVQREEKSGASKPEKVSRRGTFSWKSQYASMTLSQFGRDYPMQGVNEQGLVGFVLMGPADYAEQGTKGSVTENLWLQAQLDQYSTVQEVEDHIFDLGIKKISARLHWLLCDGSGECITVEFRNGVPQIHRGQALTGRLLTNSGVLESWDYFLRWRESGVPLPLGYDSFARYSRLAWHLSEAKPWGVLDALNDVALEGFTAWQSIFDTKQRNFWVRLEAGDWRHFSFANMELNCRSELPVLKMGDTQWGTYDHQAVWNLMHRAVEGLSADEVKNIEKAVHNSENVVCGSR